MIEGRSTADLPDRRQALLSIGGLGLAALVTACGGGDTTGTGRATPSTTATGGTASTPTTTPGGTPGASAAPGTTAAEAAGVCTLTPELTEGPFYLDLDRLRRDITEGRPGVPLTLRTTVVDSRSCAAIADAAVDIWHCDAVGAYSGFGEGGAETTFLRGVQLTGPDGVAELITIYPGWYPGRALHIHLKVHHGVSAAGDRFTGGSVSHTGQLFFPDDITTQVGRLDPYRSTSKAFTPNDADSIYREVGPSSIVELTPNDAGDVSKGFVASITLAVDPTATPR